MIAVFLSFLATALVGLFGLHSEDAEPADAPVRYAPTAVVALAALAIGAACIFEIVTIAAAAQRQQPYPSWFALLPIVPLDDRAPYYGHAPIGISVAACTLVETAALAVLAFVARGAALSRLAGTAIGVVSVGMVAVAFTCPASLSFDMYAYDGSAHVATPYRPVAIAFGGDLSVINSIYGVPITPSPYGPVWLALSKIVTIPAPTLYTQLLALRGLGVVAFGACLFALRYLRVSALSLAVVALNPALVTNYVLDGHNDLVAIALVLWGIALARRSTRAAIALGMLAGAVKLPFLLIGTLALSRAVPARVRIGSAVASALGGIVLYAAFGGRDFLQALATTSRLYRGDLASPLSNALHVALGLTAIGFIAALVLKNRYVPTAAWSFVSLAATFFGWYVAWGIPYALIERRWFVPFMISLPALGFVLSTTYAPTFFQAAFTYAVVAFAPLAAYIALRGPDRPISAR